LDERHRRSQLLFRRNMPDDGQDSSLDQHAQHRLRIRADLAGHADRLGQDMHRVRSACRNALNSAHECFNGSVRNRANVRMG
jgi:hypothetical protein